MPITDILILSLAALGAATLSAVAGFGGALILLPILSALLGVKVAIPVLTVAQFLGNASRVWLGRKELCWKPIVYFLITAVPLSLLGSYTFVKADVAWIKKFVGMMLIAVAVYRRLYKPVMRFSNKIMWIGGALTGFISGLVGSAGPLGAAFFLTLNLTKSAYVASEAFTALVMHAVKTLAYQKWMDIGKNELYLGLFLGLIMILGSWIGKRILERLNVKYFTFVVELLLIASGIKFIVQ
ncbi:MAG: sulfite exporter TauE/SafE family protein [Bacteroidia bacterium]|nr:sulfite exporter TauE/SafE family protein [Bacteroidia bacterium]MDW8301184.1 sulfite exporter TauE/SafE family protein [Bacteroidia bacterium]